MLKVFQSNYVESFLLIKLIIYWKSKANSITFDEIYLDCEEKSHNCSIYILSLMTKLQHTTLLLMLI